MNRGVAVRADASAELGVGHVVRCLALAAELKAHGDDVAFFVRQGTLEAVPALRASDCDVQVIDAEAGSWAEAMRRWRPGGVDWLVIDSPVAASEEERALRGVARRILVVDDLMDRRHDCDLLLDQNLGRTAAGYRSLVPDASRVLPGTAFALLRPGFAKARADAMARRADVFARGEPVRRILVFLGTGDRGGQTAAAVEAVLAAAIGAAIDVVAGSNAAGLDALRAIAKSSPLVTLHIDTGRMWELMAAADLAIGAGGLASLERCCLGLPSIVIATAENELPGAAALEKAQAAICLPLAERAARLTGIIRELSSDAGGRMRMSMAAAELVDGLGARRVREAMNRADVAQAPEFSLRRAHGDDCRIVYDWRNDPASRYASGQAAAILFDDHRAWYERSLTDQAILPMIAEFKGHPVAFVLFDASGRGAAPGRGAAGAGCQVSIAVAPDRRGQGLGRRALTMACIEFGAAHEGSVLWAVARASDTATLRLFRSCWFLPLGEPDREGFVRVERRRDPG